MNRKIKNFKGLSAKQIRTYVLASIMSTFAINAVAIHSNEESNPRVSEYLSELPYESGYEAEINLESWMTTSFELPVEEGSTPFVFDPTAYEMVIESELIMEDWMSEPFKVVFGETSATISADCNTTP